MIDLAMKETANVKDYIRVTDEAGDLYSYPVYDITTLVSFIKTLEVSVLPKLNGILPVRKNEALTGAQALFALNFLQALREILGLKEVLPGARLSDSSIKLLSNYFTFTEHVDSEATRAMLDFPSLPPPPSEEGVESSKIGRDRDDGNA